MAKKKKQSYSGVVYSTNPDYEYTEVGDNADNISLPPEKERLTVRLDKHQRGGKKVTLVEGFRGAENDLEALGKKLKQTCGVGGSVKDGIAIIQGDFRGRILEVLQSLGYRAKLR